MANLETGKRLADRYLLQERLGDGGHAEVWAAIDSREGRRVAFKFLHAASCKADDCWNVLLHEAQMAQRLDHPGVLKVDMPQRDGDLVFLPMECAEGGDVRALRGAPWRQVLPVLVQVANVLEHAHSRGVVHRDIKPGNVLLAADGTVRVTDFGTAARTGSRLAMADGSPFSASPQQLAGDAARTSDDVYGLGALAYELLSRYPPYYPDFDARRVRDEMPAPLVAVHPAPAPLLAFITSMLERQSGNRPDLRQVIDFFSQCLDAAGDGVSDGAAMVVSERDAPAPVVDVRRGHGMRSAAVALGVAAAAAVAVFFFMPAPEALSPASPTPPVPSEPAARPGLAPVNAEAPASAAPSDAVPATLEQELAAGRAALAAIQPAAARAAFERALLRDAGSTGAREGIVASERLAQALDAYSKGMRAEAARDLGAAKAGYAAALALRPDFEPATAGMARVREALRAQEFETALVQGAAALAAGRVDAADTQYRRAASLGGADARVKEGQDSIAEIRRSERNALDLARGAALEGQEDWDAALAHYREVLARDDSLHFAIDGLSRSLRRGELDRELQDYLDRPERLVAPAVQAAASRALARGEATTGARQRLGAQLHELRSRLDALAVKVRVEISSDNSTQVSLASQGELGTFEHRELQLPPGQYTVIGRRDGYRDVRRELNILPGQQAVSVTVQCTDRI